jgi:hypothetical protein
MSHNIYTGTPRLEEEQSTEDTHLSPHASTLWVYVLRLGRELWQNTTRLAFGEVRSRPKNAPCPAKRIATGCRRKGGMQQWKGCFRWICP